LVTGRLIRVADEQHSREKDAFAKYHSTQSSLIAHGLSRYEVMCVGGRATVRGRGILLSLAALGSLVAVGGCALMPASGPQSWDVWAGQHDPSSIPYAFVRITPKVSSVLAKAVPRLVGEFPDRSRPKDIRFGIGDIVSITIFEASSGGLFIPAESGVRPGNFVTIPNQAVDVNGDISIPFGGAIRARGRTQVELQQAIVDSIKDRAIEPQVIASLVDQRTSLISVLGDVTRPSRIPALLTPERIVDAITRAGGPAGAGQDEWVMLERDGRRALSPFGALLYEPANNILVHPNDTIYLYREPQTFLTFGALGNQQQLTFGAWRITLAEAVARAGGLTDGVADPASVFLYRGETREVAQAMGIDCSPFQGPIIPVIYNINFRNPASYFLATTFEMRNKDVIYVSNSVSTEASKFMSYIRLINATINDPISTAINGYTLKNIIQTGTANTAIITGATTPIINVAPAP
jgi:polysaccharide export outer membrane protein